MCNEFQSLTIERFKRFLNPFIKFSLISLSFCFVLAIVLIIVLLVFGQKSSDDTYRPNDDINHSNDLFVRSHLFSTTSATHESQKRKSTTMRVPNLKRIGIAAIPDPPTTKSFSDSREKYKEYCRRVCSKDQSRGGGLCKCDRPPFNADSYINDRWVFAWLTATTMPTRPMSVGSRSHSPSANSSDFETQLHKVLNRRPKPIDC